MTPVLIVLSMIMFVAVILLTYFQVSFDIAAKVLCSLGSLGVVVLGVMTWRTPQKKKE